MTFLKAVLQHCTGASELQINKDNSNKETSDSAFLEHMKGLQSMTATLHASDQQAGQQDCDFPAAYRLCSTERIQHAFILSYVLDVTDMAWQTTQNRALGMAGKCPLSQHVSFPSSHIIFHQSQLKTDSSKSRQNSPQKRENKDLTEWLSCATNYKL